MIIILIIITFLNLHFILKIFNLHLNFYDDSRILLGSEVDLNGIQTLSFWYILDREAMH